MHALQLTAGLLSPATRTKNRNLSWQAQVADGDDDGGGDESSSTLELPIGNYR